MNRGIRILEEDKTINIVVYEDGDIVFEIQEENYEYPLIINLGSFKDFAKEIRRLDEIQD